VESEQGYPEKTGEDKKKEGSLGTRLPHFVGTVKKQPRELKSSFIRGCWVQRSP
jgi:hypothetical protein